MTYDTKNARTDKKELDKLEKERQREENKHNPEANADPITGAAGAHPVGTGAGALSGAAAGAAIGTAVGGPPGMLVGGAAGAVAGGLAGKGAAEAVNPTEEDAYWREHFTDRPYTNKDIGYEAYAPAYRYGWESYVRHNDSSWETIEGDLEEGWTTARGSSTLEWDDARLAAKDAWERRYEKKSGTGKVWK